MADFRIPNLKGATTLATGEIVAVEMKGVRENHAAFGLDWTFDLVRFECGEVHMGPDPGPVDLVVFTGIGGERLRALSPGPATACIYGPYDLLGRTARVACLLDPARQRLEELLSMIPRAA